MKRSLKFEKKTPKSARKLRVNEISGQNILEINEGKSRVEMHRDSKQMQQRVQDNRKGPGLVGYVMWKSNTKSTA